MKNHLMRGDDEIKLDAFTAREKDNKAMGSSNESSQQILEVLLDIRELLMEIRKNTNHKKEPGEDSWR